MKKFLIPAVFFMAFFGCGEEAEKPSPESQKVLSQLESTGASTEVQEYFKTLAEVIDAYADMIEDLSEAQPKGDSEGLAGAMNMLGGMATGLAEMAPLLERMDELEREADILKEDMTPEELEAFMVTYQSMMLRFMEAAEKMGQ